MDYNINCINDCSKLVHLSDPKQVHGLMGDMDTWDEQDDDFKLSFIEKGMSLLNSMDNAYLLLDSCTDEMIAKMVTVSKDTYHIVQDRSLVYVISNFNELVKRDKNTLYFYRIKYVYSKRDKSFYYTISYSKTLKDDRKFFITLLLNDL